MPQIDKITKKEANIAAKLYIAGMFENYDATDEVNEKIAQDIGKI